MNETITRAANFATNAHRGQTRKYTGEPYIYHPQRVAEMVEQYGGNTYMVSAAWLHDVIEDCFISYDEILAEFGATIADMVWGLTDQANFYWNRATRKAWEAGRLSMCAGSIQTIKVADLIDNTLSIVKYDKDFAKVYLKEKEVLLAGLTDANAELLYVAKEQLVKAYDKLQHPWIGKVGIIQHFCSEENGKKAIVEGVDGDYIAVCLEEDKHRKIDLLRHEIALK